jgi:hypothetical protein
MWNCTKAIGQPTYLLKNQHCEKYKIHAKVKNDDVNVKSIWISKMQNIKSMHMLKHKYPTCYLFPSVELELASSSTMLCAS